MQNQQPAPFQEAIDAIESLPEYQQESLLNVIHNRLNEKKRETLAENIQEARAEYGRGEIKRGFVEDVMKEISE